MEQGVFELLLDEYFDVDDALRTLEARREKLRNAILAEMRGGAMNRIDHPRGRVDIRRHHAFTGLTPTRVLPVVGAREWWDDAFSVNGRALHRLALKDASAMDELAAMGAKAVRKETLYIVPHKH